MFFYHKCAAPVKGGTAGRFLGSTASLSNLPPSVPSFSFLRPCAWSLEVIVAAHERLCGQRHIALYFEDWKPI